MNKLRAKGCRELSVLDLGCGPGTWIRRIAGSAAKMGFTRITARGVDLAGPQVRRAHALSQELASHAGVTLRFEVGDIRKAIPEPDGAVDSWRSQSHLSAEDVSTVFSEVARVTRGTFLATLRAIGSTPTIYVDSVKAARAYHQDKVHGRLRVEFQNGSHASFPSRLFSAAEIRALAALIRRWGRIGCPGRQRLQFFGGEDASRAQVTLETGLTRKRKRGYAVRSKLVRPTLLSREDGRS
jgi:SAM-dependent methyltransferase